MLYIVYQEDRDEGAAEIRRAVKPDHLKYLATFEHVLVLGGAMLAEDGIKRTGSVLIVNLPDLKSAEEFSANEPFRKAGLFKRVSITRMRRGQWNPAAAPATEEGN
ncbi:MAG: YciI family protein [Janthinobacterium lividum]